MHIAADTRFTFFSPRQELLIAARHILQTDFRHTFVPHIDTLVDDRVLIGFGITCHEQLRPLAYSMIADLVHHVREELNIVTLSHVVHIYSCNLHDPTLAPSIQTMCSKLLLNLTENVVKTDSEEAGLVLGRSLEAFVAKVEAVAATRDQWRKWMKSVDAEKGEGEEPVDEVDVERSKPIAQAAAMTDTATDLMRGKGRLRNATDFADGGIFSRHPVSAAKPNFRTENDNTWLKARPCPTSKCQHRRAALHRDH